MAVPLGVLLKYGTRLSVDEGKPLVSAIFLRCEPLGCLADLPLTAKVLDALKAGKKAHWEVNADDNKTVNIPFSLKGFREAISALKSAG
ncbi:MAG: invasion associated locus B family protein [Sedimenticola sp.]